MNEILMDEIKSHPTFFSFVILLYTEVMHFLAVQLLKTLLFKVILIYKLHRNTPAVEKYHFFWLLLSVTVIKCFTRWASVVSGSNFYPRECIWRVSKASVMNMTGYFVAGVSGGEMKLLRDQLRNPSLNIQHAKPKMDGRFFLRFTRWVIPNGSSQTHYWHSEGTLIFS